MNNATVNITTPETFINSTIYYIGLVECLEICMYSINFLAGLPTHFYVIWLIIKGTGSGLALDFFNLNLSVSEIGNSLNCLFFLLSTWFPSVWTLVIYFLIGFCITGRPLFQCLMCVERYLAVVHPVTFLKYKPLRYRVICSTVVWIITLGSCLCCVYILVSFNIIVHAWFFVLQFILYLSIKLFCLMAVLRALKESGPGERGRVRDEKNHMKRRAFYIILVTTVSMVVLYMPIFISAIFINLTKLNIEGVWAPALICYVLAGFVQHVLYLHRNGKISCFCPP